jgi:xanthine dehydrogenase accessory factor
MLFTDRLAVVRGGGDLATGVVYQLNRAGFPIVVLELAHPLAIRRTVAVASAITEGSVAIDGLDARRVETPAEALELAATGSIPIMASPSVPEFDRPVAILVDARLAKRTLDTTIDQAPLVVAVGPGFDAGIDCHAVIETMRGHRLGRVIWKGTAAPNTGIPGDVGGETSRRVIRAAGEGTVAWSVTIGDQVAAGDRMGEVAAEPVITPIAGVVRGLIAPGTVAWDGLKIADVDPRADRSACFEISDKSRLVGAGVLEAVLTWLNTS